MNAIEAAKRLAGSATVERVLEAIAGDASSIETVRDYRTLAEQDDEWMAAVYRCAGYSETEIQKYVYGRR